MICSRTKWSKYFCCSWRYSWW